IVALQTMVYAQAGQEGDRERIQRHVDWLLAARGPDGWSYGREQNTNADNSNTQYALMGLHEAIRAGARVDPKVLKELRDCYIRTQVRGGWGYRGQGDTTTTMTMTTAGVCGLMITATDLAPSKQELRPDGSAVNCSANEENRPVADGLNWISTRF